MKKQVLTGIIAAAMAMTFASCGSAAEDNSSFEAPKSTTTAKSTDVPETTAEVTTEAPTETTAAPDPEAVPTVFEKFINGEIEAELNGQMTNDLNFVCASTEIMADQTHVIYTFEGAASLSLAELTDLVKTSPETDASGAQAMYAYIDTISGDKALAVRYQGVGIDGIDDSNSSAFFVFVADGDSLRLSYCADSWSRSSRAIYSNGMIKFSGNSGAGDSSFGCAIIDGDGNYKKVYSIEQLTNEWVASHECAPAAANKDWAIGSTLYLLDTADGKYYSYTADNKTVNFEFFDILLTKLDLQGYVMIEDADHKAYEELSALGLSDGTELTDWITLD